jgi:hypothetical protein
MEGRQEGWKDGRKEEEVEEDDEEEGGHLGEEQGTNVFVLFF